MWGIQELTFTTEQNTALCMCELRYRKPERRGKQQGQVPLLEYKRDEEFPLEKPRRPWPIITVDWNPCRIVTVQIHPLWPLVPKCHLGLIRPSEVGSSFEVLIHASQLYSLSLCTRGSFMTFHSSMSFCHLDLTRVGFWGRRAAG
jgi:hypothetical protein